MPRIITEPTKLEAAGHPPKTIEEYVGRVNSDTTDVSIARMVSPPGWSKPGQTPEFTEYTLVLRGMLQVETREQTFQVERGQTIINKPGEWVRYSTPGKHGAEYISVVLPAFSPDKVHRDH